MRTTPEQRADLRADVSGPRGRYMLAEDLRDLLDDLDEALAEVAALRAVAEAARDLFETAAHTEYCDVPILAEQRGKALGHPDSDNWNEAECDCHEGRTRRDIRAALRAWEERELHRLALGVRATK